MVGGWRTVLMEGGWRGGYSGDGGWVEGTVVMEAGWRRVQGG